MLFSLLALYVFHANLAGAIDGVSSGSEFSALKSYDGGATCCSRLQARLHDEVSLPGSATYRNEQNGTDGYWAVNEAVVTPACRISPMNPEGVSSAVKALSTLNCSFAIRGGGHMWWAGAANIQDGVTLDLSSINQVKVSGDRTFTSVGGGARWEDVYLSLDAMNLSVVGGRVSTVGVGGLTTGGGNSWFAARYGLACDNAQNFEVDFPYVAKRKRIENLQVVLASGQIVNANISHFPDLYKALKGGNNNFGIVTRFDLRSFPQGKLYGGFVYYPPSTRTELLQALTEFNEASGAGFDDYASGYSVFAYNGSGNFINLSILDYTKPEPDATILWNLSNVQPQLGNTLRITNLTALTIEAAAPGGNRAYWATATSANNPMLLEHVLGLLDEAYKPIQNVTGFSASVSMQPVSQAVIRKMPIRGGNSLGLGPESGNQIWIGFTLAWKNAADDATMFAAGEAFIVAAIGYLKSQPDYQKYLYLNYAAPSQDPIASYGDANLAALRKVSRIYDPGQVFQKLVPGGYKLYR